ncbi:hypothetical protein CU254_42675 (plasmid) [Amycolatopsis sp. AA4]|uniref:hypothetical protein n=1 Tax=Actinomycetes TaxID=1760 RepID=UPI0001B57BC9|nr:MULTISPECIES: hypothetical protein [Actinomycetes]ATY17291.1 hypothetical protein CU254_42675 [Amycolatopsis sp. AA4]EFL12728.1 predicted protein [Streptomyces sp. AA4]
MNLSDIPTRPAAIVTVDADCEQYPDIIAGTWSPGDVIACPDCQTSHTVTGVTVVAIIDAAEVPATGEGE